jgi:hypothetical protein
MLQVPSSVLGHCPFGAYPHNCQDLPMGCRVHVQRRSAPLRKGIYQHRFSALHLSQTIESRLIPNVMKVLIYPRLLARATTVADVQNFEVAEKGEWG